MERVTPEYVVLYHRGCNDGTAAAWCAKQVLGDNAIYLRYQYGEKVPPQVKGKHLILVDLSMPIETLYELRDAWFVKSIAIVDHHKTALPLFEEFPYCSRFEDYEQKRKEHDGYICQFIAMERCGAVLSWLFFNNYPDADISKRPGLDNQLPEILWYVEDYDLWQHRLDFTQPINRWMIDGGVTIEDLEAAHDEHLRLKDFYGIVEIGKSFTKYNAAIVKSVSRSYVQEIDILGKKAALINSPHHLRNDVGDALTDRYLFVACYTERAERTVFSLRAKKNTYDVSALAERYGGGGHADASAFSVPVGTCPRKVLKPTFSQRVRHKLSKLRESLTGGRND